MNRDAVIFPLAVALLAMTGIAVYVPGEVREVPLSGSLHGLPRQLAGWTVASDPSPDLPSVDPAARDQATFAFRRGGDVLWATVFYYPLQSEGRRGQGRDLVFPARGWADLSERGVDIPATDGAPSLSAHAVSIRVHGSPLTILYWYQVGGSVLASEHWYRAALLYTRLFHKRTDGALVRIVWPGETDLSDGSGMAPQLAFVRALHRELQRILPR